MGLFIAHQFSHDFHDQFIAAAWTECAKQVQGDFFSLDEYQTFYDLMLAYLCI